MPTCLSRRLRPALTVFLLAAIGCVWINAAQAATHAPPEKTAKSAKASKHKTAHTHHAEAAAIASAAKHRTALLQSQTGAGDALTSKSEATPATPTSPIASVQVIREKPASSNALHAVQASSAKHQQALLQSPSDPDAEKPMPPLNTSVPPTTTNEEKAASASPSAPAWRSKPLTVPVPAGYPALVPLGAKGVQGKASFYSPRFEGLKTANGETFSHRLFTAASNVLPLGTLVAVRRPGTNLCVIVKINDRMHPRHRVRVIDLTYTAAQYLNMVREGVVQVQITRAPKGAAAGSRVACPSGDSIDDADKTEPVLVNQPAAPTATVVNCKNCSVSIPSESTSGTATTPTAPGQERNATAETATNKH